MISHMRMNIFGNIMRTVHSGIAAGVTTPFAPAFASDLARAQAGAHELGELDQLGEHALHVQMRVDLGRARHREGDRHHEFGLGEVLGAELVHDLRHRAGAVVEAVAHLGVAVDEDALPRHEHIVEDHHRIRLVEPRRERIVHRRAGVLMHDRRPADEAQPLGVAPAPRSRTHRGAPPRCSQDRSRA